MSPASGVFSPSPKQNLTPWIQSTLCGLRPIPPPSINLCPPRSKQKTISHKFLFMARPFEPFCVPDAHTIKSRLAFRTGWVEYREGQFPFPFLEDRSREQQATNRQTQVIAFHISATASAFPNNPLLVPKICWNTMKIFCHGCPKMDGDSKDGAWQGWPGLVGMACGLRWQP